ncbi:hypothetical protein PAN31117_04835 [Pandoraea anapnoica]|uniref:DUF4224 domain-containing protein n=1 Tax=Pandoraea anapnoica TaxID=2508301 RepID=A0A5E5AK41_9BURK|nr:DUF4224 domain-containing protein [Pandoraea anapnoica]VVE74049.1 hypothetical protein PAN31117_04835 [Pandoraea anapnoica]
MADMFLSPLELETLTGRKIKSKQVEALRRMGLPFFINACGRAIVARSSVEGRPDSTRDERFGARSSWHPAIIGG